MTLEQNKDVTHRFFDEIVNTGNAERIAEFATDDYHLEFPGQAPLRRDQVSGFLAELHTGFPDFQVRLDDVVAEGDAVAMLLTMSGTHRGLYQGMPPTGRHMEVHGQVFMRLRDGRIVEDRPVFDRLALLEQLGFWKSTPARSGASNPRS